MNQKSSFKYIVWITLCVCLFLSLTSARRSNAKKAPKPLSLTSIHIIDRNGFAETMTSAERLKQFQEMDFLKSSPYQKVLRIYERDSKGDMRSVVTTYYPNGNIKQLLEILNARAHGLYQEWHENGKMSLSSKVIGGTPDITPAAQNSWVFDGLSTAWDENGNILAEIPYSQGILNGTSIYYHNTSTATQSPAGRIWKKMPYAKGLLDGIVEIYQDNGDLLQRMAYSQNVRQGPSVRFWNANQIASQEEYDQGKLENGQYFDQKGQLIAEVSNGNGYKAVFSKNGIYEQQEYRQGILEGEVKVLNNQGRLKRVYHVKNRLKHGEEVNYYDYPIPDPKNPSQMIDQPKLSFNWYEGKVQGTMKTWYSNGNQESQREMSNNVKNGILTAWYRDGSLMMIEEYEQDNLVRGEYFKRGERIPVSLVNQGKGLATIFDADGHFVQKITYQNGEPESSK